MALFWRKTRDQALVRPEEDKTQKPISAWRDPQSSQGQKTPGLGMCIQEGVIKVVHAPGRKLGNTEKHNAEKQKSFEIPSLTHNHCHIWLVSIPL